MNVLNKQFVLKLNRAWQPIDQMTVAEAVTFLCSESHGKHPGYALDVTTAVDENGDHVIVSVQPVAWEQWVKLPVREDDLFIGVGRSANNPDGRIRVPLIVICANYDKVPLHQPRLSAAAIFQRDKGVCQYTGEYVGKAGGNLDHVTPRDRGGRDSFENLVWCKKQLNSAKGNRLNHEIGLTLLKKPTPPPAVPPVVRLREDIKHPIWKPFLQL